MILVMHFGWEENVRAFQRGSEQNENLVLACTLKNGIVLVSLLMPLQSLGFCLDCRLAQNRILMNKGVKQLQGSRPEDLLNSPQWWLWPVLNLSRTWYSRKFCPVTEKNHRLLCILPSMAFVIRCLWAQSTHGPQEQEWTGCPFLTSGWGCYGGRVCTWPAVMSPRLT